MGRSSKVARACTVAAAVCLSLACIGCHSSATSEQNVDAMVETTLTHAGVNAEEVAAVVSGRIITQQQVDEAIWIERVRYGMEDQKAWRDYLDSAGATEWDIRATTIRHMVDDALVETEAARLGINVEAALQSRMAALEALYPSRAAFIEAIEDKGYTEASYTEAVRKNLLWEALRDTVINAPEPTTEQISQYAVVLAPTLVGRRSSHILVLGDDYDLAVEVSQRIIAGEDFDKLARMYSIDASAAAGGDVGWDSLNTFVPIYQETLDSLEPGEVSDVVRTPFGYQIIKCTDKYEAPVDDKGNLDMAAIPDDLMDVIVNSMSQNLTSQLFNSYICTLEATLPIAVFNERGEQVPIGDIGLTTEVASAASSTEEIIAGIIDDVRNRAQSAVDQISAALQASLSGDAEVSEVVDVQDAGSVVDSAVDHTGSAGLDAQAAAE